MKILIVEDEALASERLHGLIRELYPDYTVFEARNGFEALEKIMAHTPEIMLLDIRMPGMDGLELTDHLLHFKNPPAIIFTTAYQDYALRAFDANAIDYLVKPIHRQRLKTAIERAHVVNLGKFSLIKTKDHKRRHLSTMLHGRLQLIAIEKIHYLKAEQKYVIAAWPEGELLLSESLAALEKEFSSHFIRIHRNALASKNHIDCLSKTGDGQAVLKFHNMAIELVISRRHLPEIRQLIKQR